MAAAASRFGAGASARQPEPVMELVQCPVCGDRVPPILFPSIRGESKCLRCQIDACRDYMEGTRRMLESGEGSSSDRADLTELTAKLEALSNHGEQTREMLRTLADKLRIPL